MTANLIPLPLRLAPGEDLRDALLRAVAGQGAEAAFVLSGIGSLAPAVLRRADAQLPLQFDGPLELLTLQGSLGPGGPHLHASVADAEGRVIGGHVASGCRIRTTAEVLLVLLPGWSFGRLPDPQTGWNELSITPPLPPR